MTEWLDDNADAPHCGFDGGAVFLDPINKARLSPSTAPDVWAKETDPAEAGSKIKSPLKDTSWALDPATKALIDDTADPKLLLDMAKKLLLQERPERALGYLIAFCERFFDAE